jgi:hypothetical protein
LPLVIHPRIRRNARRLALTTAVACLGITGSALAACPTAATTQPFAQFGDTADYSLAPGGSFEDGGAGWALNGNAVANGNESFFASAQSDSRSLTIAPGGSVVSAPVCVDATTPFLRVFGEKLGGGPGGSVRVDVLYTDGTGTARSASAGKLVLGGPAANGDYTRWSPSPIMPLSSLLDLSAYANQTTSVQLRFSTDRGSAWAIDDVYIDPYRA